MNPSNNASSPAAWARAVSRYLATRKQIRGLRYRDIGQRLRELDIDASENNLKQRFNQGTLSAQLFAASLIAMGEKSIDLEQFRQLYREESSRLE